MKDQGEFILETLEAAGKLMEDYKDLFQNLAELEDLEKTALFQKKRLEYLKKAAVNYNWVRLGPQDAELFK
jgi:hypothetical protein